MYKHTYKKIHKLRAKYLYFIVPDDSSMMKHCVQPKNVVLVKEPIKKI